jgi:hypothetical protein
VAGQHGLAVTWLPKPMAGQAGSGCHMHFSLRRVRQRLIAQRQGSGPGVGNAQQLRAQCSELSFFMSGCLFFVVHVREQQLGRSICKLDIGQLQRQPGKVGSSCDCACVYCYVCAERRECDGRCSCCCGWRSNLLASRQLPAVLHCQQLPVWCAGPPASSAALHSTLNQQLRQATTRHLVMWVQTVVAAECSYCCCCWW